MANSYIDPTFVLEMNAKEAWAVLRTIRSAIKSMQDDDALPKPDKNLTLLITVHDELDATLVSR